MRGDIYKVAGTRFYSIGDSVIVTTPDIHKIYESLINNNFNNNPVTDTTNWSEVSSTNRWKCFDNTIGSQSSQATSMSYVLAPGAIDSVALLNMESSSVQISLRDPSSDLITNGTAWTGATGTTPPTGWDTTDASTTFLIDSGAIKITAAGAGYGMYQQASVTPGNKMQLLGAYKNTAGDIAQFGVYDVTHSAWITALTDLASSITESTFSNIFTVPAGCVVIRVYLVGRTSGDIVWFDTVQLSDGVYDETVTTGASKTDVTKLDLPQFAAGILTVTVNNTGSVAKVGEIKVGVKTYMGKTAPLPAFDFTNYSTTTIDTWGHYDIVPRAKAKILKCTVIVPNTIIDEVNRLMMLYADTLLVWVVDDEYNCMIALGYLKKWNGALGNSAASSSRCNWEAVGIT